MLISSLRQRRATFIQFFWGVEDISEAEIYGNIFNVVCEWKLH